MKFKFYSDPGHGWLAVKRDLLVKYDLLSKISSYSYQRGKTVYLEEDCDAAVLIDYLRKNKIFFEITEKYVDRTPIRSYDHFTLEDGHATHSYCGR